jgi:hypothetical protein
MEPNWKTNGMESAEHGLAEALNAAMRDPKCHGAQILLGDTIYENTEKPRKK